MFFKEIQARVELPLVNLVTATFDVIAKTKLKNIGLIGTRPTMEFDFYKTPFQNIGIDVHVPLLEDDREFLKIIILEELSKEIFKDETISRVNHIIEKMKEEQHIDGIILGCTGFPLFVKEEKIGIPAFDTIDIHVEAIIKFMKTN
jgi:aspartate racemase